MPLISRVLDRQPIRSLDEYVRGGGGAAARAARAASPSEIIELVELSGLRGRGGAGFPTGTKWRTVAAVRSSHHATTVVVNAAEGEPGTFKDRALLRANPYRVLEGAIVAAIAMQSDQIRIGIKGTFDREISRLEGAIREMRHDGWLVDLDLQLVLGPSSYLFGEETALLEVLEGRQPFPRVTPPYRRGVQEDDTRSAGGVSLATLDGSEGPPALVDNVETLANIPLIIDSGPEWFRELGTEASPGTIVCTVSGATRRSAVGEVPLGSTLRDVIDLVGWGPRPEHDIQVVLSGTANALIPPDLLDTPLTYEAMREAGSGLGSAGFIVYDDTTEPLAVAAGVARFLSVESCGQCEHCKSDGLEIAEQLRRSLLEPTALPDTTALRHRLDTVTVGARCNLAQQQSVTTTSLLELFSESLTNRSTAVTGQRAAATIAPIRDLDRGRATLDTGQLDKQPDWSFDDIDSGATPAARLGNTPVHITAHHGPADEPEASADVEFESSLPLADDLHGAHAAIEASIERALEDDDTDLESLLGQVIVAVRTHIDVTRRVLFPMARRIRDDDGDRLADAVEAQEETLLSLVDTIDRSDSRRCLQDIAAAMQEHAAIGEELLVVLQADLDPTDRSRLADGLAAARATSTVSRLYRNDALARVSSARPARIDGSASDRLTTPSEPSLAATTGPAQEVTTAAPQRPTVPTGPQHAPSPPTPVPSVTPQTIRNKRGPATVIVGVDGSSASGAALEWAGRFAARAHAEVLVTNVFEPDQAEISPTEYDRQLRDAEQRLREEWTSPLEGTGAPHRCLQLTGTPDQLLATAESERADLLVVGTRGSGRYAALHLGSLAHHLAHYTRTPLAIVPAAGANAAFDRIVIGVDGSPTSAAAVSWCADMAVTPTSEVTAVWALGPYTQRGPVDETADWWMRTDQGLIHQWTAPLRAAGARVRTEIVDGKDPRSALEEAARAEHAHLFVVGIRELSAIGAVRFDRLPMHLVHHTHLPVILVPPATHDRPGAPAGG